MPPKRQAKKKIPEEDKSEYLEDLESEVDEPEVNVPADDDDAPPPKPDNEDNDGDEDEVKGGDGDEDEEASFEILMDDEPNAPAKQSDVVRRYIIVPPNERMTSERMTTYEVARVLGDYAVHVANGAPTFIDTKNYSSPIEIAYDSLVARKIPMCILRHVGVNEAGEKIYENWKIKEMTLPQLPPRMRT